MHYFLHQFLPLFIYPIGLSLFFWVLATVFILFSKKSYAILSAIMGLALLWVSATPVFSNFLLLSLENEYPPSNISELPTVDAIVILAGGIGGLSQDNKLLNLGSASDRLFYGHQLYKANKASLIILSGGGVSGYQTEAEAMSQMLRYLNVEDSAIIEENESRNTRENALFIFDIMKQKNINKIILVTSAFHMKRALATFQTLDMNVIPAATDYNVTEPQFPILNWLPDADHLYKTTYVFKEYIGWFYYCMKGWISEY